MITAGRQGRGAGCPSDLSLHRLMVDDLSDVERRNLRDHLGTCPRCADRLTAFEAIPLPPHPELPMRPLSAERAADARRARRILHHRRVVAACAAVAAATALVLVIRGADDAALTSTDVRVKGDLALGIIVRRASGETERIASGARVAAGEVIRFELAHAGPGHAAVVGLDARQTVSVYVPRDGAAMPILPAAGTALLPGAIRLDDAPGAERLFGLLCADRLPVERIQQAARARLAAEGRPERVKTLDLPCAEASFLITKAERP